MLKDGAAEELGESGEARGVGLGLGGISNGEKIGGAVAIDDGLDGAGEGEVFADIELPGVSGGAEEGDEMATGGGAPDADAGGIDIVLGGVGAKEADGGLAIFKLSREDACWLKR
ncbi:hypothetical protein BH09VER1_BH09VER1_22990 [soil metagenome]